MTFTTNDTSKQALQKFQGFDVDTQLAILWFGYLDIKDQLTPANATSAQEEAAALYHAILAMPKEEQLQAQRDIASRADTDISRAYKAVSSSSKLDVWLRLAQGMDKGEIITVPSDYQLPEETNDFVAQIKQLDFEERINFTRSAVIEMGAK
ncbi:Orange carotenoid protein [Coleofasciculus sp. FACHB-64]|uniref:orange carotenoid protein N-terminal domain-containing protein n=1 Tax=Cyanophyceae TaxID=3028117 RepID=UPI001682FD4A|nr:MULTISPECIES: orange carotenoid protein N-terminal domain-containing protein [unclassified Coleofasciculus]MBD1841088.1 Orange carotenoid protein [Coleofasciculus sp. FACHB-501]MBD1877932.1 Orange carotenoid protein [Coleofasciculus sp. FACHB-T130]MBD1888513.1 Orange carotenoid protein [Coleofasciculus sp. FACHB-SPT9]MBD1897310.1 Orange carotenoid protein [Coleofasciculus sp. FACHB-129]MBD1900562.1 Orange carotenoid protein [Coleofasciculus sp. FACHB-125]